MTIYLEDTTSTNAEPKCYGDYLYMDIWGEFSLDHTDETGDLESNSEVDWKQENYCFVPETNKYGKMVGFGPGFVLREDDDYTQFMFVGGDYPDLVWKGVEDPDTTGFMCTQYGISYSTNYSILYSSDYEWTDGSEFYGTIKKTDFDDYFSSTDWPNRNLPLRCYHYAIPLPDCTVTANTHTWLSNEFDLKQIIADSQPIDVYYRP